MGYEQTNDGTLRAFGLYLGAVCYPKRALVGINRFVSCRALNLSIINITDES